MSVGVPAPRNTTSYGMPENKVPARPLPAPTGPGVTTYKLSEIMAELDEERARDAMEKKQKTQQTKRKSAAFDDDEQAADEGTKPRSFIKRLFGKR